ncbi:MAG: TRAP transporter small permease [Bacillota bacterium]
MLKRLDEFFVKLNGALLLTLLGVMFLLVFTNVVTRYLFGFSMNWAEEAARYLMIGTAFLGAGLAMREGKHVAIEIVQSWLPRPVQRALRALVGLIILAFMSVLMVLGYQYTQFGMGQETAALQIPAGAVYLVIPIGAAAFILHMIAIFREYVETVPNQTEEAPEENAEVPS